MISYTYFAYRQREKEKDLCHAFECRFFLFIYHSKGEKLFSLLIVGAMINISITKT